MSARGEKRGTAPSLQQAAHAPRLVHWVAEYLSDGAAPPAARADVSASVETHARLRRNGGARGPDVLREYEVLAEVLAEACTAWLQAYDGVPAAAEVAHVTARLNRAALLLGVLAVELCWAEEQNDRVSVVARLEEFADLLAHELKTPLNAAAVSAQLLEYTPVAQSGEARRLSELIRRNLARADGVLQNVRNAAVGGKGGDGPVRQPFGQVLATVLADVRDELAGAGVRLEVDEPIPGHRVDAASLRIVLVNLIRNAIRHRSTERQPRVRLSFEQRTEGTWWVHVSDNGPGVPDEYHGDIFRRSVRSDEDGSGLGLLIVHREVERLGGETTFESSADSGTRFSVSIPGYPL